MAKFVVILGFLLSFAAGMVIGSRQVLVSTAPADATPDGAGSPTTAPDKRRDDRRGPGGWLSTELKLSDEQRKVMNGIWSDVAKSMGQDDRRRQFRRDRDEAIAHLVPPERLGDYDRIIDAYQARVEDLEQASRGAYEKAVAETKAILTPEQRARYEEILKRHRWGSSLRDRRDNSSDENNRRGEARATTSPQPEGTAGAAADAPPSSAPSPAANPSHN